MRKIEIKKTTSKKSGMGEKFSENCEKKVHNKIKSLKNSCGAKSLPNLSKTNTSNICRVILEKQTNSLIRKKNSTHLKKPVLASQRLHYFS